MSEFVRFYQGKESEYIEAKEARKLEDCFYFTETDTGGCNLYLNEHTIFSSENEEKIAQDVIDSETFKAEIKKYLPIEGGTITGNLNVEEILSVKKGLNIVNGKISALNFKDEGGQVTIPCALIINGNTTINGLLTLDKLQLTQGTLNNCNLTNVTNISFANGATLTNLPTYTTQQNYEFDFNNANLKVNSVDAQSITINGKAVPTEENAIQAFQSIQIGSIILSDDGNGNLAITSVG